MWNRLWKRDWRTSFLGQHFKLMLLGVESAGWRSEKERYKGSFFAFLNWGQTEEVTRVDKKRYLKFWKAN